jgi:hypothetical protein
MAGVVGTTTPFVTQDSLRQRRVPKTPVQAAMQKRSGKLRKSNKKVKLSPIVNPAGAGQKSGRHGGKVNPNAGKVGGPRGRRGSGQAHGTLLTTNKRLRGK